MNEDVMPKAAAPTSTQSSGRTMQRFTPLLLSVTLACAPTVQSEPPTPDEIRSVINTYDAAWNRRDSARVAAVLAPDYVYFSSTGQLTPRAETLALLTSPNYVLTSAERSELQVTHAAATVALASSRWRGHGRWQGKAFTDDQRCSLVFGRTAGHWQLLAEHCTQIAQ
jgi:ketosteroid isomerase-like protein